MEVFKLDKDRIKQNFWMGCKREFEQYYSGLCGENIVLFGTGSKGKWFLEWLTDIGLRQYVVAFSDNNKEKWGTRIDGVMCENIDVLHQQYDDIKVIICSTWEEEIRQQLCSNGIVPVDRSEWMSFIECQIGYHLTDRDEEPICDVRKWIDFYRGLEQDGRLVELQNHILGLLVDEQSKDIIKKRIQFFLTGEVSVLKTLPFSKEEYFSEDYFAIGNQEVLVDCGAYIGDTIDAFLESTNGKYKAIHAFEPDNKLFAILQDHVKQQKLQSVSLYQIATSDCDGEIRFHNEGTMGSHISDNGAIVVPVRKLDDVVKESVSILKMDIEGAELGALKGAADMIKRDQPNMAICIYHRWDDIFTIPAYIHSLVPEYKFKVRQHEKSLYETVLYAYIEK